MARRHHLGKHEIRQGQQVGWAMLAFELFAPFTDRVQAAHVEGGFQQRADAFRLANAGYVAGPLPAGAR